MKQKYQQIILNVNVNWLNSFKREIQKLGIINIDISKFFLLDLNNKTLYPKDRDFKINNVGRQGYAYIVILDNVDLDSFKKLIETTVKYNKNYFLI